MCAAVPIYLAEVRVLQTLIARILWHQLVTLLKVTIATSVAVVLSVLILLQRLTASVPIHVSSVQLIVTAQQVLAVTIYVHAPVALNVRQ
jgi:hypothetical protein